MFYHQCSVLTTILCWGKVYNYVCVFYYRCYSFDVTIEYVSLFLNNMHFAAVKAFKSLEAYKYFECGFANCLGTKAVGKFILVAIRLNIGPNLESD